MTTDVDTLALQLRKRGLLDIVDKIADEHGVTRAEVLGTRRFATVARARQALYVELRTMGFSYPEIGRLTARDHTTVLSGVRAAGGSTLPPVVKGSKPRPIAKTSWRARCGHCGQRFEDHMSKAPHDLPLHLCPGFAHASAVTASVMALAAAVPA